jgi:glycosyltransferase involved in cell wall biosynthesis
MPRPLLSFVMPVFNAADVVEETVRSVFGQGIDDCELVAVNDASVDASARILRRLAQEFPQMRVLEHASNRGGAVARNTAIQASTGPLLRMIDADNIIPPGVVEKEIATLRTHQCDAVSVSQLRCFARVPGDLTLMWEMNHGRPSTLDGLLSEPRTPPAHGNYLFTRRLYDLVGGYPEGFGAKDTWAFGLRHLAHGLDIHFAPDSFYYHRVDRASYWIREEQAGRNDLNTLAALREAAPLLPPQVRWRVERLRRDAPVSVVIERGLLVADSSPRKFDRAVRRASRHRSLRRARARATTAAGKVARRMHLGSRAARRIVP